MRALRWLCRDPLVDPIFDRIDQVWEEVMAPMGFVKHGQGEVLPEDEQEQKTAAKNWTDEDREELARENEQ